MRNNTGDRGILFSSYPVRPWLRTRLLRVFSVLAAIVSLGGVISVASAEEDPILFFNTTEAQSCEEASGVGYQSLVDSDVGENALKKSEKDTRAIETRIAGSLLKANTNDPDDQNLLAVKRALITEIAERMNDFSARYCRERKCSSGTCVASGDPTKYAVPGQRDQNQSCILGVPAPSTDDETNKEINKNVTKVKINKKEKTASGFIKIKICSGFCVCS